MDKPASKEESSNKNDNTAVTSGESETTFKNPPTSTQSSGGNNRRSLRKAHATTPPPSSDIVKKGKEKQVITPQAGKSPTFSTPVPTFMGTVRKVIKVSIPPSRVSKKVNKKLPIRTITTRSVSKKQSLEKSTKKAPSGKSKQKA